MSKNPEAKLPSEETAYARVFTYLHDNGSKTLSEISEATGINKNTVRTCLFRLAGEGRVCKTPVGEKGYFQQWQIGKDESYAQRSDDSKSYRVIQRTVSTWTPERRRDPLTAALFGMSNVDRRK